MFPLPSFVGIIPTYQPLDAPIKRSSVSNDESTLWIGEAFKDVIYRKYEEVSYTKIDDLE